MSKPDTPADLERVIITPRVITKQQAAEYCGCSMGAFDSWRAKGIVPGPIPGTARWDRHAIDAALDRASGLTAKKTSELSPYQRWKAENAEQSSDDTEQTQLALASLERALANPPHRRPKTAPRSIEKTTPRRTYSQVIENLKARARDSAKKPKP